MMTEANTPNEIYELAQRCCEYDLDKRPTFKDISDILASAQTIRSINGVSGYHIDTEEYFDPEVNRPNCVLELQVEDTEPEKPPPRRGSINPLIAKMKNGPPTNRAGNTNRKGQDGQSTSRRNQGVPDTLRGTKEAPTRSARVRGGSVLEGRAAASRIQAGSSMLTRVGSMSRLSVSDKKPATALQTLDDEVVA